MKRRIWLLIVGVIVLLATAILITRKANNDRDDAALQEQLRLARAEGLPTTWQEYAALVPTAAPSENAGPFYSELKKYVSLGKGKKPAEQPVVIEQAVTFDPSPQNIAAATRLVGSRTEQVRLADQATLLPKCWFDRDWSKGPGVLMPEWADMKGVARLISLRGSIAASRGDVKDALANVQEVFVVARHAGCEPNGISHFVREGIFNIGLRDLINWSFMHRDQPAYRDALEKALDEAPRPDLKTEHTDELCMLLWIVDHSLTPQGRKDLGIDESDVPEVEKVAPLLVNRTLARTRIVAGERMYWDALAAPQSQLPGLIAKSRDTLNLGLAAFPLAGSLYEQFFGGDDPVLNRRANWESRRLEFKAALRALQGSTIPTSIKTSDLLSPFDGKPLAYRFDGKQIVISVSGYESDSKPVQLKLPPDPAVKK